MRTLLLQLVTILGVTTSQTEIAIAQVRPNGFNDFILRAVEIIGRQRASGGYDLNANFTRDLTYGDGCCVKASRPPATQCVAAVAEIIIEAINLYARERSTDITRKLPMKVWTGSTPTDIRPYIWKYDGVRSNGTANALRIFGIGIENTFGELRPGDFVTFNRTGGSGHSVVFLGFLDALGNDIAKFSTQVAGFKYFSAQGKNSADAGFAYRWGYFEGTCPNPSASKPRDCGIVRRLDQKFLNTGYMLAPALWPQYTATVEQIRQQILIDKTQNADDSQLDPTQLMREVDESIRSTLKAGDLTKFDGVTTD